MDPYELPKEYLKEYNLSTKTIVFSMVLWSTDITNVDLTPGDADSDYDITPDANYALEMKGIIAGFRKHLNFSKQDILDSLKELNEKKILYLNFLKDKKFVEMCTYFGAEDYLYVLQVNDRAEDIEKLLKFFPKLELLEIHDEDDDEDEREGLRF